MINKNDIVFLIRTYNERKRIPDVISSINDSGFKNILIVDDGSTDKSKSFLSSIKGIIYIKHPFNRGGGAALETGFEYLRRNGHDKGYKYVVTFDADGQHDIKDINHFIKAFEKHKHLDIVLGSRFIKKTKSNVPFVRKIILMGGKIFTYLISGIYLTDAHNGYRMVKVSSLKKIIITMNGMEYASELIEQIRINNLKFMEVPVNITYDEYSIKKGQKSRNAFKIAFKMIKSKLLK